MFICYRKEKIYQEDMTMKGKSVKDLFKKTSVKIGSVVLAAAIVAGSLWAVNSQNNMVPELVTFVDTDGSVSIEGDGVPLAAPKVTKSTKTKKKTKKIKLKKASTKTYKKKGKSTTKKSTKKSKSGSTSTTTVTVVATNVMNQYKKGSKVNTQVTTTKTTVTKTVMSQQAETLQREMASSSGNVSVATLAPLVDSRVANAFNTLGFSIKMNSSVSYSGLFDARSRSITLKRADSTIYHELGHFLAFIAGNYDMSAEFKNIYNREKANYTAFNKAYVLSNSSEYFAESFKNYTLEPAALQASRPETYKAIQNALSKVTDSQVSRIWNVYKAVWQS